jgi:hypothetical protein
MMRKRVNSGDNQSYYDGKPSSDAKGRGQSNSRSMIDEPLLRQ